MYPVFGPTSRLDLETGAVTKSLALRRYTESTRALRPHALRKNVPAFAAISHVSALSRSGQRPHQPRIVCKPRIDQSSRRSALHPTSKTTRPCIRGSIHYRATNQLATMDAGAEGEPSRKRRAITACSACRTAKVSFTYCLIVWREYVWANYGFKVACVGGRPCVRCARNGTACYDVPTPAPTTLTDPQRIERLEAEVRCLQNALNAILASTPSVPVLSGPASPGRASAIPIRTASAVSFSFRDSGAGEDLSNHFTWATPTVDETSWSQPPCVRYTAVEEGLVTWEQATLWFNRYVAFSLHI